MTRTTFDPNASRMLSAMAAGHLARVGHQLRGYYATDADGISTLTRTCCEVTA